jgi:hypothetical protein
MASLDHFETPPSPMTTGPSNSIIRRSFFSEVQSNWKTYLRGVLPHETAKSSLFAAILVLSDRAHVIWDKGVYNRQQVEYGSRDKAQML